MLHRAWIVLALACGPSKQPSRDPPREDAGRAEAIHPDPVVHLASSSSAVCATRASGRAYCWGSFDETGAAGVTLVARDALAAQPGAQHVCVLRRDRSVSCRGSLAIGGTRRRTDQFHPVPFGEPVRSLQGGCAIFESGRMGCVTAEDVPPPVTASIVSVGERGGCAVVGGAIRCWGARYLKADGTEHASAPIALQVHRDSACALRQDGSMTCWGRIDPTAPPIAPTTTRGFGEIARLGATTESVCVIRKTGDLACWSFEDARRVLQGEPGRPELTPAEPADPWTEVVDSCARRASGRVFCWGRNDHGQVTGTSTMLTVPQRLQDPVRPRVLSAFDHPALCAVIDDGSVVCWPTSAGRPVQRLPVPAAPDLEVIALVPSLYGHCALERGGRVMCWLDEDSHGVDPMPRPVPGLSDAIAIAGTGGRLCAVHRNGHVSCGDVTDELSPLRGVPGIADATTVAVGRQHACVLRRNGGARCWGERSWNGRAITRGDPLRPFDVPGLKDLTQIAVPRALAGPEYVCGVDKAGTGWCWGEPSCAAGRLCQVFGEIRAIAFGDTAWGDHAMLAVGADGGVRDRVRAIPGLSEVHELRIGTTAACALHRDRSVSCWGLAGELLNSGHRTFVRSPIEIDLETARTPDF